MGNPDFLPYPYQPWSVLQRRPLVIEPRGLEGGFFNVLVSKNTVAGTPMGISTFNPAV